MFSVGDKIAHPLHGAGIINSIEEKRIDGTTRLYYEFKQSAGGMLMMIPVDNCEKIGVRPIISCEEADRLIDSMNGIEVQMNTNWNRRYRENMTKIKSGDLLEVATVIKGLMARDSEKGLSTGERKMLRSAKQILISELVMSKKMDYDAVEKKINAALA
ncbi:MAG: CarD family transcriptional regulator [Oscillospiraceae bacterium]|nr:CarD family transcriptional regulator [Oscillospiraceae bacterium]